MPIEQLVSELKTIDVSKFDKTQIGQELARERLAVIRRFLDSTQ